MRANLKLCSAGAAMGLAPVAAGQITIDPAHKHAWSENIGWTNWADANGGSQAAKVHTSFLSGFVWTENAGWINLGDGTPANGVSYANVNGADAGVNLNINNDRLSGYAWGENIGWINFGGGAMATPARPARIDFVANRLRGYAWGENVGWLNLDDATHFIGLGESCYADCDTTTGPGVLDIFDFLCFQNRYAAMEPYACDCDVSTGPGVCDIFDFLCFQNAFAAGCP